MNLREINTAKRAAWAIKEGLHSTAVEYARNYHNLTEHMLHLISDYEVASDMAPGPARETGMKDAFAAVIAYVRTLSSD
jgi:hypothetical protein